MVVFLKEFFEKVDFEKISRRQKSMQNFAVGEELRDSYYYFCTIDTPINDLMKLLIFLKTKYMY